MKCEVCGKKEGDRWVTTQKPGGRETFALWVDALCALWLVDHPEGRFALGDRGEKSGS